MKSYTTDDLKKFGIDLLTGEACGYQFRILCDLTAEGLDLVREFFGLTDMAFQANWNLGTPEDPHVGSIMLTPDVLPELIFFALCRAGHEMVLKYHRTVMVTTRAEYKKMGEDGWLPYSERIYINPRPSEKPASRNEHQMSGRIE